MLEAGARTGADDADFVPYLPAGARAKGEFHCAGCGYGVTISSTLPLCPMCAGGFWEQSPWSPLARAAREPL